MKRPGSTAPDDVVEGELDRQAVLRRRDRFVRMALAGLAGAAVNACGPTACLDVACREEDGCFMVGLDADTPDGGPEPDAGRDAGSVVIVRDAGGDAGDPPDASPTDAAVVDDASTDGAAGEPDAG